MGSKTVEVQLQPRLQVEERLLLSELCVRVCVGGGGGGGGGGYSKKKGTTDTFLKKIIKQNN